jgi:hypothetical protein
MDPMTTDRAQAIIAVLLDGSARVDERDDAAMDLSGFNEPAVHAALGRVATDPAEPDLVAGSAGESLAELWVAAGALDAGIFARLTATARAEAVGILTARAPGLLAEVLRPDIYRS